MRKLIPSKKRRAILVITLLGFLIIGSLSLPRPLFKAIPQPPQEQGHPHRLIHEKSPFLLQHANNPVDWYPWGEMAFKVARQENKPIFLSIGYSTCYWCHVMERDVFEDPEIASLMNRYFVNILVDREEQPDVDQVYMAALVAMTGNGGWPVSMFLTPDLKPFYGASTLPPEPFRKIIESIHDMWTREPAKILSSSQQLAQFLKDEAAIHSSQRSLEKSILEKGYQQLQKSFDNEHGGFGRAPKFPRPQAFEFLLHYYHETGNQEALSMTLKSLNGMARGGVYDHVGGGFHRYSVDDQWRVPHFEKMLNDQAELAISYLEAFQITRDKFYSSMVRGILAYVLREMTDPQGGFYTAEDAESAPDPQKPSEKQEGAYYVWTKAEIDQILGKDQAEIFEYAYGVLPAGNVLEDPRNTFVGKNILFLAHRPQETAKEFSRSEEVITRIFNNSRAKLLLARKKRPWPFRDDKILTSWNGLMISALARAYQVLGDPSYKQAGERAADFILANLYNPKSGKLLHRYRGGDARYDASLKDYAFLTQGLLDLYEATFSIRWLKEALALTQRQNAIFYDEKNGGFFDTAANDGTLLFKSKGTFDDAEPSGNSIATLNLLRLAQITDNPQWRKMAKQTLVLFGEQMDQAPGAIPQMLVALDYDLEVTQEIVIAGPPGRADTMKMLRMIYDHYLPNKIVLLAEGGMGQEYLSHFLPFIKFTRMRNNKATAYICENYTCKLPTSDLNMVAKLLNMKGAE